MKGSVHFDHLVKETDSLERAPADAVRRLLLKAGLAVSLTALWQTEPFWAQEKRMAENNKNVVLPAALSYNDVYFVSPTLEHYTKKSLLGGVWKRPGLSPRDRSVATVVALIARIQNTEMPYHFALALDNGVKPSELSEIIAHLAFYAGWANAMSAVFIAKDIFRQRGIGPDQLPPAKEKLLPRSMKRLRSSEQLK